MNIVFEPLDILEMLFSFAYLDILVFVVYRLIIRIWYEI